MLDRIKAKYHESWIGQPTGTTRGRAILTSGAVIALSVSVPWLYLDAGRRERSEAEYLAGLAVYENARDERARCVAAVGSRSDFRLLLFQIDAVLNGQLEVLRSAGSRSEVIEGLAVEVAEFESLIERDWQERSLDECPPEPVPPSPPR